MTLKTTLAVVSASVALATFFTPLSTHANAGDSTASARASEHLSGASGKIVSGSVGVLAASGELVVIGVEQSAHGESVVMKNATQASGEIITVLIDGAAAASLAVGHGVRASATGVGHVLVASGKVIAFIPNEIGRSLIHQSRYNR
jgi:hypothetical protein